MSEENPLSEIVGASEADAAAAIAGTQAGVTVDAPVGSDGPGYPSPPEASGLPAVESTAAPDGPTAAIAPAGEAGPETPQAIAMAHSYGDPLATTSLAGEVSKDVALFTNFLEAHLIRLEHACAVHGGELGDVVRGIAADIRSEVGRFL